VNIGGRIVRTTLVLEARGKIVASAPRRCGRRTPANDNNGRKRLDAQAH
jgi:hypothetical protein